MQTIVKYVQDSLVSLASASILTLASIATTSTHSSSVIFVATDLSSTIVDMMRLPDIEDTHNDDIYPFAQGDKLKK